MIYELCSIQASALNFRSVAARAMSAPDAGLLLGGWQSEIGALFRISLLRAWPGLVAQREAHEQRLLRADESVSPLESISYECFSKFPFLPEVTAFPQGKVFEMRTYYLHAGGLAPTLKAWEKALNPAHEYTSHLVINMYALDGPPRIVHLWSFDSLEQRAELRARHYALNLWPPQGGPEQIAHASNTILLPLY
ncbi:NIPSNAP family protein [Klebsiella pneumoniae]|uniref:NIPSNAP family protein n=1 Tax=Klebsiella pneumoniae TaxID=573 RepID=UPI002119296C|nr:NIPSNAP family protein [Klebsiella pneumoniae]MCQ8417441.1 NIPSNAP family protein [Klebsiella pneumoniae]HBW3481010.1 NIPSNAP family protein [Klebsiella pneumoniae]HDT1002533.1 NIPSNAP family protein [Klebsiella pneumoniae subsp. pneumoniae]